MRLSDLRDKPVRSLDGKKVGRIHEVHAKDGKVTALMCGPAGFIERLTARRKGRRIDWSDVRKVTADAVIVADDRAD
jgi:sporulation protein YlmC with PRC-barrel domain